MEELENKINQLKNDLNIVINVLLHNLPQYADWVKENFKELD